MSIKHHIEQEIKLTAPDQLTLDRLLDSHLVVEALHDSKETTDPQQFNAIYYDTPDWHLRKLRWSLRTREEGDRHVGTLKRNGNIIDGISSCEEIEQAVETSFTNVANIPVGKIADSLKAILPKPTLLLPRVNVNMRRTKRFLKLGETILEFVTDAGHIAANGNQMDLFEVELELLSGDLHADEIQSFVRQIIREFGLRKSHASKHQLGLSFY